MKPLNTKTLLTLTISSVAAALITGCTSSTQTQVVIVTATAQPTPIVVTATPAAGPVVELSVQPTATVETTAAAIPAQPGTLLKGSESGVFYLTTAGERQHIYDWDTFLALGLAEEDIVTVADELLAEIPLAGELTRLVMDEQDNLYWIAAGQRWRVNDWKEAVRQHDYTGLLVTPLDRSLQARLPARAAFEDGALLRVDDTVYYLADNGLIPLPAGAYQAEAVIDIPQAVLAVYGQPSQLEQASVQLQADTPAANVRQGPSLQAQIIGTVQNADRMIARGRTGDNAWLQIVYQDQPGWLAADLVEDSVTLNLLPVIADVEIAAELPQAEPAAVTEDAEPQPIYCTDVPIRGFGRVWADHPELQAQLGCPYSWQGGEQSTQAAVQIFQHGVMVWLETDSSYNGDPVYVFFADGTYQRFGDLGPADPDKMGTIPTGFYEIGDKFSKVYWEGTGARVKERLGYATDQASDSGGAYQQFSNGRMFWVEAIDRIFVILQYLQNPETQNYEPTAQYYNFTDCFEVTCE